MEQKTETGVAISSAEYISKQKKQFKVTQVAIKKIVENGANLVIKDISDKEGYDNVVKGIALVRTTRTGIDAVLKGLKAPTIAFNRAMDAEAKRIKDAISPTEESLKAKKKVIDDLKEVAKQQKIAEKAKKIEDRSILLMKLGMNFNGLVYEKGEFSISNAELFVYDDKNFESFCLRVEELNKEIQKEKERREKINNERSLELKEYIHLMKTHELMDDYSELSQENYNDLYSGLIILNQKEKEDKEKESLDRLEKDRLAEYNYYKEFHVALVPYNFRELLEDDWLMLINGLKDAKIQSEAKKKEEADQIAIDKKIITEEKLQIRKDKLGLVGFRVGDQHVENETTNTVYVDKQISEFTNAEFDFIHSAAKEKFERDLNNIEVNAVEGIIEGTKSVELTEKQIVKSDEPISHLLIDLGEDKKILNRFYMEILNIRTPIASKLKLEKSKDLVRAFNNMRFELSELIKD